MLGTRVVVLTFVFGLSRSSPAQVIAIEDQSIGINGKTLVLPASERDVLDAIGEPVVAYPPVGDKFSNWEFRWPTLGIEAYSNPTSRHVEALVLLTQPQRYWHGNLFSGELWLDGKLACPSASDETLSGLGFRDDEGNLTVRRGCFYVEITRRFDGTAEEVSIGTRAEWPLVPFPGYEHGQPDPCARLE